MLSQGHTTRARHEEDTTVNDELFEDENTNFKRTRKALERNADDVGRNVLSCRADILGTTYN